MANIPSACAQYCREGTTHTTSNITYQTTIQTHNIVDISASASLRDRLKSNCVARIHIAIYSKNKRGRAAKQKIENADAQGRMPLSSAGYPSHHQTCLANHHPSSITSSSFTVSKSFRILLRLLGDTSRAIASVCADFTLSPIRR